MTKFKFSTPYKRLKTVGEINRQPSLTVPDMSLTVREIVERSLRGLPTAGGDKIPVYHGEEVYVPDFDRMDLPERENALAEARQRADDLKEKYRRQEMAKKVRAVRQHQQKINQGSSDQPGTDNPDPKAKLPAAGDKKSGEPDKK